MNAVVATGVAARSTRRRSTPRGSTSRKASAPRSGGARRIGDLIAEAWRFKQQMGGAMRQAGIIAAGGVHALRHHVDPARGGPRERAPARRGTGRVAGLKLDPANVETNLVFFDVTGPSTRRLRSSVCWRGGFRMGTWDRAPCAR